MILLTRRDFFGAAAAAALPLNQDPDRPRFHLLPPANWMNDPNAPIYWRGRYHMYYQHNPRAAKWDTMHWGYAVSSNLTHWEHRPIALAPSAGWGDKDGCFTGCAVVNKDKPTILYTGVQPEVQMLAESDDMQNWRKRREPVIAAAPAGVDTPGFRDPHVWREGSEWLMLIGAGLKGKGGTSLLYSSRDLVDWTYIEPVLVGKINAQAKGGDVARGEMWECPDFFEVNGRHVFYVSTEGTVKVFTGMWKDRKFKPENDGILIHGAAYAPKSCQSAEGKRRLIFSWLREQRSQQAQLDAGWSGVMSLAAVPSVSKEGKLTLWPAAEYETLRDKPCTAATLPEDCVEIDTIIDTAKPFKLSRGGQRLVEWDPAEGKLWAGPVSASVKANRFRMKAFVDGSVIEVFTSEPVALAGRVYGSRGRMEAAGAGSDFKAWTIKPISADRLTS